ncbi:hypothetical protein GCM10027598_00510 [Amycolatopsis oliviviridis]|uniref:Type I restriction modification DNA specificity domain-containing protein n=1 Tax=Amycolatopsis oliviviridis TaxID=1471590 RepID=A0ABQ3LQ38_9PSEU|nr:hypothetical protein GCM10017790_45360 [Amycolatopsis oliviviridis]
MDHSDRNVTREGVDNGTKLVQRNAVLFVVRGMSLKTEFRVGMSQREVAFGQDCKALVARDGIDPYYLFYSIRSKAEHILTLVDEAGHGTGRLVTDRLEKLEIPLLAEPVQGELVAKLSLLSELAAARQRESRKLVELRDTLLPKLMSGELRIKDAERKVEDAT